MIMIIFDFFEMFVFRATVEHVSMCQAVQVELANLDFVPERVSEKNRKKNKNYFKQTNKGTFSVV